MVKPLDRQEMEELRDLADQTVGTRDDVDQDRYSQLLERYDEAGGPLIAKQKDDQRFIDFLIEVAGERELTVRSYSGRAMHGQRCLGVEVDNTTEALKLGYMAGVKDNSERHSHYFDRVSLDSTRRGVILYWEQCKLQEEKPL